MAKRYRKMGRLPTKLSALILVALHDLEEVEKDKRYVVNMDKWHTPVRYWKPRTAYQPLTPVNVCHVCFAGSVMARRDSLKPQMNAFPENFSRTVQKRLLALNSVRTGAVASALEDMGVTYKLPRSLTYVNVVPYERDTVLFKQDMQSIAERLAKRGL